MCVSVTTMCVRVCRGVCVWVCTSGAGKAVVCVKVCKGLCVWMCTGGAGIATGVCMCACMWVCGNVQWLDKDCKTHAKKIDTPINMHTAQSLAYLYKFFPQTATLIYKNNSCLA